MEHCPEPCAVFKQCSTCLKHSHCGWCSLDTNSTTGQGLCTEGSLEAPSDHPAGGTCEMLYNQEFSQSKISFFQFINDSLQRKVEKQRT